MRKIIIVGAGPIGCYLGQLLKKGGIDTLVVEEHKQIGRPVHCAGLVGRKVFDEARVPITDKTILNTINGAIISLGGDKLVLRKPGVALVIDREKFDKELGRGLDVRIETKFLGLERKNNHYLVETDRGEFECDLVVGADGARSMVREYVAQKKHDYLRGVQFRIKRDSPSNKDIVEVHIKKPYFYWIIPEQKDIVRVGILSRYPYKDLVGFIKEAGIKGRVLEKFAGIAPLTYTAALARKNIFLVGDSASQVKPLSYGGVYLGMKAAEILADCIIDGRPAAYPSLWQKRYGQELKTALTVRSVIPRLSEKTAKKIFSVLKKHAEKAEREADYENHSPWIRGLMKDPQVAGLLPNLFLDMAFEQNRRS